MGKYCNVQWNDTDAASLATVLHFTHELAKLNLTGNSIGDAGCNALADALRAGAAPKLTEIQIAYSNPVSERRHKLLQETVVGLGAKYRHIGLSSYGCGEMTLA